MDVVPQQPLTSCRLSQPCVVLGPSSPSSRQRSRRARRISRARSPCRHVGPRMASNRLSRWYSVLTCTNRLAAVCGVPVVLAVPLYRVEQDRPTLRRRTFPEVPVSRRGDPAPVRGRPRSAAARRCPVRPGCHLGLPFPATGAPWCSDVPAARRPTPPPSRAGDPLRRPSRGSRTRRSAACASAAASPPGSSRTTDPPVGEVGLEELPAPPHDRMQHLL